MESLVAGIRRDEAEPDRRRREPQEATVKGALSVTSGQLGLWAFLGTVTMLFAGFTSAYLVRQTTGSDWSALPLPPVLWINTAVLLASSATLERGRMLSRRGQALPGWLLTTLLLGLVFLAGQLVAWRTLAAEGIFLPANPHASFFYVLTAVHAAHLLGGIAALTAALVALRRTAPSPEREHRLKLCATYWHFVGGAWLYLFLVLFVL